MKVVKEGKVYDVETIDYWDNLKHRSAIANMQAILGNNILITELGERAEREGTNVHVAIAQCAVEHAECLVNELKKMKD